MHTNTITVYITTVFPCIIYTPTCFDILCHQGVTYRLLQLLNFIKLLLSSSKC